ncbi:phage tail protein [Paracoccus spongiarum]|uniref:Tail fiber protein n=1 Tax=Paracoccus spongiarum TaxID=3064387 RepID=A0ABT9JAX2_9RHOB|nr:tail fiber protein [Paracoccus sp. 2205BS29-5]MDP5306948.1 tail fiber protein [Paracoccus sp. 2205BS29-5]
MDPLIGQIIMFAGTFAPRGWALCDGQSLRIDQHPQLFSLLGTTYGGDGRVRFALPDLRGRLPLHAGAGPGLTPRRPGDRLGTEEVALSEAQMPAHVHEMLAANRPADRDRPSRAMLGQSPCYAEGDAPGQKTALAPGAMGVAGKGLAHDNMPPVLCVNFIIATEGLYPSRA